MFTRNVINKATFAALLASSILRRAAANANAAAVPKPAPAPTIAAREPQLEIITGDPTPWYQVQTTSAPDASYLIGLGQFTDSGEISTCKYNAEQSEELEI